MPSYLTTDKRLSLAWPRIAPLTLAMADDEDQDIFDSLEREASEFTKVSFIVPAAIEMRLTRAGCGDRPHSQGVSARCVSLRWQQLVVTTSLTLFP